MGWGRASYVYHNLSLFYNALFCKVTNNLNKLCVLTLCCKFVLLKTDCILSKQVKKCFGVSPE